MKVLAQLTELVIAQCSEMGWEKRGERFYFYDAVWEDGRCVKRYRGAGLAGNAAAKQFASKADHRAAKDLDYMKFANGIEDGEAMFADASRQANVLMEAALLADNCYQASHTWRRRRRNGS